MSLETTYKEYILEQLMKVYLEAGEIPTADDLEEDLETYQEEHPDLSLPRSKYEKFSIDHGAFSSASELQEMMDIVSADVGVATHEIYNIASDSSRLYQRWIYELKRIAAKTRELETRVDNLLLLAGDTAGYFATTGDIFSDMNLIDTDNTSAAVNLKENSVTLNAGTENFGSITQLSTEDMTESDAAFSVLSRRAGVTYAPPSGGNKLVNIFKSNSSAWVGTVRCTEKGPITTELKARISPGKDAEVSKITLEYTGSDITSSATVTAQYSEDGYTWYLVPTDEATKSLVGNLSWAFPITNMRWVKFIFHKPAPDEVSGSSYRYEFGIRSVAIFGNAYHPGRGDTFVSQPLFATDTEENPVGFSLVQLETCEIFLAILILNILWPYLKTIISGLTGMLYSLQVEKVSSTLRLLILVAQTGKIILTRTAQLFLILPSLATQRRWN